MTKSGSPFYPAYLLLAALFALLILSVLVQDSMSIEGMIYASIARNLANDSGSFWNLRYTDSVLPVFHTQPPLAIALQSVFFWVFGDGLWIERFYSFLMALLSARLIMKIWRLVFRQDETTKEYDWLPVLLWLVTPVIAEAYANNVLENTMAVFDLMAVNYLLSSTLLPERKKRYLLYGALSVLAAVLCKGLPGLFPLAVPLIYWVSTRQKSLGSALQETALLIVLVSGVLVAWFFLNENAGQFYYDYMRQPFADKMQLPGEVVQERQFFMSRLFVALLPALTLFLAAYFTGRKKSSEETGKKEPAGIRNFFFLLALSASLPFAFSREVNRHCLLLSVPFYALGLASVLPPYLFALRSKFEKYQKTLSTGGYILFTASVVFAFSQSGKIERDAELVRDIHKLEQVWSPGGVIAIPPALSKEWNLHAYSMRYLNRSLDPKELHHCMLVFKTSPDSLPKGYYELLLPFNKIRVFRKEDICK